MDHLLGRLVVGDDAAIATDHLADHPDNVLAAWIAGAGHARTSTKEGT